MARNLIRMAEFDPKQSSCEGKRRRRKRTAAQAKILGKAKRAIKRGRGFEISLSTKQPWIISTDCRVLVEHVANANAVNTYLALQRGVDLANGTQRPAQSKSTVGDKRRMVRSGRFMDNIRRSKVSGRFDKARCTVSSAGGSAAREAMKALRNEAKRGQIYFTTKGEQRQVIRDAVRQVARAALAGKLRDPEPGMKKAKAMTSSGK